MPPEAAGRARFVFSALFAAGAATLILEIAGTRAISPFYGSSIYCWSALITVTLVALAVGYSLGGRRADRDASLALFSRLLGLAGAAVAVAPLLRRPVLRLSAPLGVQFGALASAAILVAPALALLSMLGPIAIRLTASELGTVGRRTGDAYAVSTVGSVLGAVLAGFVLIPRLPISQIFYGTAALLLGLAALGAFLARGGGRLAAAAAAALALCGLWPRHPPKTNVLLNRESAYGQIKVLDASDAKRYLLVNGTSQSVARLPDLESDSQYVHALEWPALLRPRARRGLVIGTGAGLLPSAWERAHGLVVDCVEIDPEIIRAARAYFGFAPRGEVFAEDGRTFLEKDGPAYDLIALDAFGGESPPYHLFSRQALAAMKQRLEPGGILAVNIVSIIRGPGSEPWLSAYRTLRAVFPRVRAFSGSAAYGGLGNVLLFASEGPLEDGGASRRARPLAAADIGFMLESELVPGPEELRRAPLLSDDHAPMEFLLAKTAALWRATLQDQIAQVLLY